MIELPTHGLHEIVAEGFVLDTYFSPRAGTAYVTGHYRGGEPWEFLVYDGEEADLDAVPPVR